MRITNIYNSVIACKRFAKALALMMVLLLFAWPIQISHAALAGDADLTFGSMGIALADFGEHDVAKATVIQPDGRIVSVGYTATGGSYDFALARHNADGSPDTSFGNGGKVSTNFGGDDLALDVALQPDGKILSVGTARPNSGVFSLVKWAMTRHNSDGSLDTSFGNNGLVVTHLGDSHDEATGVALQPDGKIVVAGDVFSPPAVRFGLVRYNSDGSLDSSFGSGGKVILPPTGFSAVDFCNDVVVRPNGKILTAGSSRVTTVDTDFLLVQFNSDGTVDQSFGNNGVVFTNFDGDMDIAYSIALQSDDKIILAGESRNVIPWRFALARYNSDGSVDSTFGSNGSVLTSFGTFDHAFSVAIASDGKIVVAGNTNAGPGIAVARYNTQGFLDSSFGSGGKIVTAFASLLGARFSAGLQSDDKIVVAGSAQMGSGSDFALLRYEAVSSPDTLISNTTVLVNSFNLPPGTTSSLNSKLNDALAEILAEDEAAACSSLQDFINYVQAQTGKKISESQAQQLLTAANEIRVSIGCP